MNKFYKITVFLLCAVIAAAGVFPAAAVNSAAAEECIDEIIGYNLGKNGASSVQGWIDGALSDSPAQGAEWYVLALSRYGAYDWQEYETALLGYLEQNEVTSASSRLKFALVLAAIGSNDSYITEALEKSVGKQGIMSLIFGLHLLNNGYSCSSYSAESLKNEILSLQQAGGWSLTGTGADTDVTAMALQALAPFYEKDSSVKAAADAAVSVLSELQQADGGYSSYGVSNPESAAQVLLALSSLGIDAQKDERFIKNGRTVFDAIDSYRLADGSYCHKAGEASNATATVQVFYSMVGYAISENGHRLYVFDLQRAPEATTAATLPQTEPYTAVTVTQPTEITETEPQAEVTQVPTYTQEHTERPTEFFVAQETTVTEQTTVAATAPQAEKAAPGYKLWAALAIGALALIICAILIIMKKGNAKNILFVALIAAAAIAFIVFSDIRSTEDFAQKEITKANAAGTVTMSIDCLTVTDRSSSHIPDDGVILAATEFEFEQGDTVYDVLLEAAGRYNIHTETQGAEDSVYVEGIGYIYELDFGNLSGWMYFVNGSSPDVGCGEYTLTDGDIIEWRYTCNLGEDF